MADEVIGIPMEQLCEKCQAEYKRQRHAGLPVTIDLCPVCRALIITALKEVAQQSSDIPVNKKAMN